MKGGRMDLVKGKCGEKESDEEEINQIEEERMKEKNMGERLMER